MTLAHHQLDANGLSLHFACQGEGPLVVLCHGYPGLWYSWRHQLPALAGAGYRVVAMDMRGYGRSTRPPHSEDYRYDKLSADVMAVLDFFGEPSAVVIGHDFGANLAWHLGAFHPDRIRAIAPLCSPYDMELAGGCDVLPSTLYAQIAQEHFFHMHYYQFRGVAEAEYLGRERELLLKLFWALSAEGDLLDWSRFPSEGTGYLDVLAQPSRPLPWAWLSEADFEVYLAEYLHCGPESAFIGGINSYRAMDHNWRRFRSRAHCDINIPALFIAGEEDPVVKLSTPETFQNMRSRVKDLRGLHLVPGAGHFVQQEQPEAVNALLIDFLASLPH